MIRRLFGGILLATGLLIMTGSGLCSLAVIGVGLWQGGARALGMIQFPLIFGGLPFGIGFGLFYAGRVLLRREDVLGEDELDERFR
jgi:hypothetical protein